MIDTWNSIQIYKKRIKKSNYRAKNRYQKRDLNNDRQIRNASRFPLDHEAADCCVINNLDICACDAYFVYHLDRTAY